MKKIKIKFLKLFVRKEYSNFSDGFITYGKYCSYINSNYPISDKEYTHDLWINLWFVLLSFSWITKKREILNVK